MPAVTDPAEAGRLPGRSRMDLGRASSSIDGRPVAVVDDLFVGAVDGGAVTREGVTLNGWALSRAGAGEAAPPSAFIVTVDGAVCLTMSPNIDRGDLLEHFGPPVRRCGFSATVPVAAVPHPFVADVGVYAVNGDGQATALPHFRPDRLVDIPVIRTGEDFMRLVQTPSTRLKNSQTLLYAAVHALPRFRADFAVRSAALCVIGYRLLMRETEDPSIASLFWDESRRVLAEGSDVPRGLHFRWHTSLRLVCGYLLYRDGAVEAAIGQFGAIRSLAHLLGEWPTALTNVLLGIFLTGYLLHEAGDARRAGEAWALAPDLLRTGAATSVFANVYAYGELENAVRVARECHVGTLIAAAGGPLQDASLAPLGRTLDLRGLGVIAHLVHERAATVRASRPDGDRP